MDSNSLPLRLRKDIVDFDLEAAPRGAVSRFCAANGISRSAFYKIRARARALPNPGQVPLPASRAAKAVPARTAPEVEQLVVAERQRLRDAGLDCGPLSIRARLVRAGHEGVPSRATIARILTRYGQVSPQPRKRPRSSYKSFRWPRPNDMWQLDGTEWRLDDEKNTKQVIYQVEDDHSRMIVSWCADATENGPAAIRVVSDGMLRHGAPRRFLTDNAKAFNQSRRGGTAPLERYLQAFGVQTISGQIAKPTTQGKNERLHQTLQRFLEARRPITTPEQLADALDAFADEYNNRRPHQALDGQTPAEAYAATPKAEPPEPPAPAQPDLFDQAGLPDQRPGQPRRRRPHGARQIGGLLIADRAVGRDGRVLIAGCAIQVGKQRAGQQLHISITDDHLELFGPDGNSLGVVTRPAPSGKTTQINLFSEGIYCA
jgi:transposase InsO family protein